MKKNFLYLAILLIFPIFLYAQQNSIYDKIIEIKNNPRSYTIVIGERAKADEARYASEVGVVLGITKSSFDTKISQRENLVIIGILGHNNEIIRNIGMLNITGMLIKVANNNLIIAGSDTNSLEEAADIIKNYEENKGKLQKEELSSANLLSPPKEFFSNIAVVVILVGLFIAGGSAALIVRHNKKRREIKTGALVGIQDEPYNKLKDYIAENLKKGHSKETIRNALLNSGWKLETIDSIFRQIKE